jgi:hypothetical protein
MCKLLTIVALAVVQVLPWTGGPLFACTASDGSTRIDRGPGACEGCDGHGAKAASCCDDDLGACRSQDAALTTAVAVHGAHALSPASCDCTHELLASAPATQGRRQVGADADRQFERSAALPGAPIDSLLVGLGAGQVRMSERAGIAGRPAVHTTTVLRC